MSCCTLPVDRGDLRISSASQRSNSAMVGRSGLVIDAPNSGFEYRQSKHYRLGVCPFEFVVGFGI
jgi:hypothetical protein